MIEATARWYASGVFWSGAAVVITLTIGIIGAAVTYVVGYPKRRLLYALWSATSMAAGLKGIASDLEVRHHGVVLKTPRILEIGLISRGRKDIPSSSYDQSRPIRLDVGTPILDVLGARSYPESCETPKITADGTFLLIGPSLIRKSQRISIPILIDGSEYHLKCQSTLIDVEVSAWKARPASFNKVVIYAGLLIFALVFAFGCLLQGLTIVAPAHSHVPERARNWVAVALVLWAVAGVLYVRLFFIVRKIWLITRARVPLPK